MDTSNKKQTTSKKSVEKNGLLTIECLCSNKKKDYKHTVPTQGEDNNSDIEIVRIKEPDYSVPNEVQVVKVSPRRKKKEGRERRCDAYRSVRNKRI